MICTELWCRSGENSQSSISSSGIWMTSLCQPWTYVTPGLNTRIEALLTIGFRPEQLLDDAEHHRVVEGGVDRLGARTGEEMEVVLP